MITTTDGLAGLLDDIDRATRLIRRSDGVPDEVAALADSFDSALGAATPARLGGDPYLLAALWAGAFRTQKALRNSDPADRRRDVRIALEQCRHALRDIVETQPYSEDTPARKVLARTVETLAAPQKSVADLLGVSVRQLQRWLGEDGPEPVGDDAMHIRAIGQIVNQLRHTFTGPGTLAWFQRAHPVLGERPIDMLKDPLRYPQVLAAATTARAMTA